MLRQADNKVKIEGILAEVDIHPSTFKKNGVDTEAIGGKIIVNVTQPINGEEKTLAIPVHMFATKKTNAGKPNPAYESIQRVANEFMSIAAAGGEEGADRVRITSGNIRMNEYYSATGKLVSFPRVNASFIQKIVKKSDCKPHATFETELVVLSKNDEFDRNDEPTGRYKITAALPQYGGKVDIVELFGVSEGVIQAISTYWEVGDTVKATGRLDFSSTVETTMEEQDFGEPIEKVRTINKSDLIITGGSQEPLDGDLAFESSEIKNAIAERNARLEEQKNKDMSRTKSKQAPAQNGNNGFADLGF